MRLRSLYPISLVAALAVFVPFGTIAAGPATNATITVSAAKRPDAVRVSGTVAGAHQLQAVLYATFDPEIPRVFLSRQPLATDTDGHFDAVISIAPAFFTGTVITVIVQTATAVSVGLGSLRT
jgi:hypothetical protein